VNVLTITQPGISTGSPASRLPVGCLRLRFSPHQSRTGGGGKNAGGLRAGRGHS